MKKFLLAISTIPAFLFCNAQMHNAVSPEAISFYNKAIPKIKPEIASYISSTAVSLAKVSVDTDSLCREMKKQPSFKTIDENGCRTITFLVLVKCSMNADAELKQKVLKLQREDDSNKCYDETSALVNRKSELAAQINALFPGVNNESVALKDLR